MAKSRFVRRHIVELALSVFIGLALVGCGTQTGAGSGANGQATTVIQTGPFCVAPVEGIPDEGSFARGHCPSYSSYSAPIEGSPEQTAAEWGR
jgi:hypothetical protein